jgi:K+-sensing histidine kinase KdpD
LRSETVAWDTDARMDLLAAVEEETDHLNQLVGNMLNMSRIESGSLKPDRSWNSLAIYRLQRRRPHAHANRAAQG